MPTGGNGPFFLTLVRESEQPTFLASPQLIQLIDMPTADRQAFRLADIASLSYPARFRKRSGGALPKTTSYDLVDKHFGILSVEEPPSDAAGLGLTILPSGKIAFGRIRPYLANISVVPQVPHGFVISHSEWIVVDHRTGLNHLLCAILRTRQCLEQVFATSGQTRPRISIEVLAEVRVPWPFSEGEAKQLNGKLGDAMRRRADADGVLADLFSGVQIATDRIKAQTGGRS